MKAQLLPMSIRNVFGAVRRPHLRAFGPCPSARVQRNSAAKVLIYFELTKKSAGNLLTVSKFPTDEA